MMRWIFGIHSFSIFSPVFPGEMSRLNIHQSNISYLLFVCDDDWDTFPLSTSTSISHKFQKNLDVLGVFSAWKVMSSISKWMIRSVFHQHSNLEHFFSPISVFFIDHSSLHYSYSVNLIVCALCSTLPFSWKRKPKKLFSATNFIFIFINMNFCCNRICVSSVFLSVNSANVPFYSSWVMNKPFLDSDFMLYVIMSPW